VGFNILNSQYGYGIPPTAYPDLNAFNSQIESHMFKQVTKKSIQSDLLLSVTSNQGPIICCTEAMLMRYPGTAWGEVAITGYFKWTLGIQSSFQNDAAKKSRVYHCL
jgi:hypothetical protein